MGMMIDEARADFDLFWRDRGAYRAKVESISDLLRLKADARLQSDYLPTYLVGNYLSPKPMMILFGINPGFHQEQNDREEKLKGPKWEDYHNFVLNFFHLFHANGMSSKYYSRLAQLFAGLDNRVLSTESSIYSYYQENLINVDLIPYHSTTSGVSRKLLPEQEYYLSKRLGSCLEFVTQNKHRMVIVNGGPLFGLLEDRGFLKDSTRHEITKQTRMYLKRLDGIPYILFNRMITQAGSGVTFDHMRKSIPEVVTKEIGI